ncbi:hypothetical protein LCGC14_1200240, partial [marine sediment metagenome]
AILKAGGCYIPLDPSYPAARLAHIFDDAKLELVITHSSCNAVLERFSAGQVIIDSLQHELNQYPSISLNIKISSNDLAYIIYTSGSTGNPKGVQVEHQGVVNYLCHAQGYLTEEHQGGVMSSPLSFDATVTTLFTPLISGKTLVVLPEDITQTFEQLAWYLFEQGERWLFKLTPAHLDGLYPLFNASTPCHTKHSIVLGGEQLLSESIKKWQSSRLPYAAYINEYGPTETVVGCTIYTVDSEAALLACGHSVLIGKPIANTQLYVLNGEQLTPQGGIGELCIGGDGVTRGYLNRPELTAEKYITFTSPDGNKERIYRSGDLVRYQHNGELKYLGRIDEQVKLRGYRIELGEIEAQLRALSGVSEAAVVMQGEGSDKHLIGFVTPTHKDTVTDEQAWLAMLSEQLRDKLVNYMQPSALKMLAELPLTSNGKVDKKRLPLVVLADNDHYVAANSETEQRLEQIWQNVLGLEEPISIRANFFQLGGHSLIATQLITKINAQFSCNMSIKAVFEFENIAQMATYIDSLSDDVIGYEYIPHDPDRQEGKLSFTQQRLWFLDQLYPQSVQYNMTQGLRISGELEPKTLEKSINQVLKRHSVLRSVYRHAETGPVQVINASYEQEITILRLEHEEMRTSVEQRYIQQELQTPFNLSNDCMLRTRLLSFSTQQHTLLLTLHHIAADGWSLGLLTEEICTLYEAYQQGHEPMLRPLPVSYLDYALWQHQRAGELQDQLQYWTEHLQDAPTSSLLPTDHARTVSRTFAGEYFGSQLDVDLTQALKLFCKEQEITEFMLIEAALAVLIRVYSAQQDVVIGTPVSGRLHEDVAPLIGCFVNNLALRNTVCSEMTVKAFLSQTKTMILDAYEHQEAPFEQVVDRLSLPRTVELSPLFQVQLIMQHAQDSRPFISGFDIEALSIPMNTVKYDLELHVVEHQKSLYFTWQYSTELYERASIERFSRTLECILREMIPAPDKRLTDLSIISDEQKLQLANSNNTAVDYSKDLRVEALFEQQTLRSPDAPALIYAEQTLTYQELNVRTDRLATYLVSKGIGPGHVVGICLERSANQVIAVLAVLKSGAAYLPINPDLTDDRIHYICEDSKVEVVLSSLNTMALHNVDIATWYDLNDEDLYHNASTDSIKRSYVSAQDLAYIIYTSGSTGNPKGVQVEHQGVVNYLCHAQGYLTEEHQGGVMSSPLSFDATVTTLFTPLISGKTLVVLPEDITQTFEQLAWYLFEQGERWLFKLTPAHLDGLYPLFNASTPCHTKHSIVLGGEQLLSESIKKWQSSRLPYAAYINEYGPTETVVGCTIYTVDSEAALLACGHSVLIGKPIANTQLYVLNGEQLTPQGGIGELCIGGDGVTRGYLNRPELTAEKYITFTSPDGNKERIYRSGDLVRYQHNGELKYLGRIDEQVKLRGYRIELGEIEAQLRALSGVSEAAVVMQGEGSDKHLIGFVTPTHKDTVTDEQAWLAMLSEQLRDKLVNYMQPSALKMLAELPLTSNGKVDKKRLPLVVLADNDHYVAANSETEQRLEQIWQSVLGLEEPISIRANFFQLGGHSILAVQIIASIYKQWDLDIKIQQLFELQTLEELASFIDAVIDNKETSNVISDNEELEEMEW